MKQFKNVMKMGLPGVFAWMIVMSFFTGSMSLTAQSAQVISSIPPIDVTQTMTQQMSLSQIVDLLVSAGVIGADKVSDARLLAGGATGNLNISKAVVAELTGAKATLMSVNTSLNSSRTCVRSSWGSCREYRTNEVSLVGEFKVQVKSRTPLTLRKGIDWLDGVSSLAKAKEGNTKDMVRVNSFKLPTLTSIEGINFSTDGIAVVPANKAVTLSFTATVNPKELLAGQYNYYYGSINGLSINYNINSQNGSYVSKIPFSGSMVPQPYVTVVGETSPYISSVIASSSDKVFVQGVRMSSYQKTNIKCDNGFALELPGYYNQARPTLGLKADNGTSGVVNVGQNLPAGYCMLQITDPNNGASNIVNFYSGDITKDQPTLTIGVAYSGPKSFKTGDKSVELAKILLEAKNGDVKLQDFGLNGDPSSIMPLINFALYDTYTGARVSDFFTPSVTSSSNYNYTNWSLSIPLNIVISSGKYKALTLRADAVSAGDVTLKIGSSIGSQAGASFNIVFPVNYMGEKYSVVGKSISTQPSITVISPNGGENLFIGQVYSVDFKTTIASSSYKDFQVSLVDELNSHAYVLNVLTTADKYGEYYSITATAPKEYNIVPGNEYKVDVTYRYSVNNTSVVDQSDNYFKIIAATSTQQ
ncbi:MAG: hypothetical protein WCO30_01345 [bacterium]